MCLPCCSPRSSCRWASPHSRSAIYGARSALSLPNWKRSWSPRCSQLCAGSANSLIFPGEFPALPHGFSLLSSPPARLPERIALIAVLALACLVSIYPFAPNLHVGRLEATVLDVGQGDSIFVAFPDNRTMLIDGGGLTGEVNIGGYHTGFDVGEQVVSPYLWSRGIKRLDVVLLTHAHHDHIDGLRAVLNNFQVGELWVGRDENSAAYRDLLAEAAAHHVPVVHRLAGQAFDWNGTSGEILWPDSADAAPQAANNDS